MKKTSKKSIIVSAVLAIVLCVSLAVGATFALFTSESPVNIAVTSGKVKIEATISDLQAYSPTSIASNGEIKVDTNAATGTTFANGGYTSLSGNEITLTNMTPGDKVTFTITIKNFSNVNAKYRTTIQKGNDDGLYAGLKFNIGGLYVESSTLWTDLAAVTDTENGEVVAEYTCTVELPANAGNTYQGKSCSIAYNVEAVQGNAETVNTVTDAATMKKAMSNGGIISINKDIKTDNIGDTEADRIIISNSTTLNLDAKVISPDDMGNNSTNFCALIVDANTVINAGKNGGIDTGKNGGYAINVRNGANLTITGGNYYGGGTAVQVQKGTLTITGGHFAVEAFDEPYGYNFMLNCIDSAYKSGDAKIIVMGGTFVNFDPSNNASEGAGTSYVADGYTVISETQPNGDIWYTVVPGASVSTADELASALASGKDVALKNDITLSENTTLAITKSVTIYGNGNKLIWNSNSSQQAGRVINIESNEAGDLKDITLTLSGVDIVGPTDNSYNRGVSAWGVENLTIIMDNCSASANHYALNIAAANTNVNVVVRNTTLTGYSAFQTWSAGTNATFENCTLIGVNQWEVGSNDYATIVVCKDNSAAAKDCTLTFKNCRIEANTSATATAPASEKFLRIDTTGASVTFEGCTFFVNGTEVTGDAIRENMGTQTDTSLTIK